MSKCLAVLVLAPLFAAAPGYAQPTGSRAPNGPHLARPSSFGVNQLQHPEFRNAIPFADGMITERDVSSSAFLGMGLVPMNGRRRDGLDMRADVPRVITRNPAVTFVVKF